MITRVRIMLVAKRVLPRMLPSWVGIVGAWVEVNYYYTS